MVKAWADTSSVPRIALRWRGTEEARVGEHRWFGLCPSTRIGETAPPFE